MIDFKKILEPRNRGILLDIILFIINLISMIVVVRLFAEISQVAQVDVTAKAFMGVAFLGLCLLSPVGAILKRRGAHQRNPNLNAHAVGCLWLPYFLSQIIFLIFGAVMLAELSTLVTGNNRAANGLFAPLFLGIPLVAIVNTLVFLFYFLPPKHEPVFKLLESPRAEALGDICLSVNLIGYQVLWLYLIEQVPRDYRLTERVLTLVFMVVLFYLPPRLFYLIENRKRPEVWLTMVFANSPIVLRLFWP